MEKKYPLGRSQDTPPKVSVLMLTYNHEKFIADAVNSVVQQVADFKYEIVIGNDCSKDKTGSILDQFQKKYSDKIRVRHSRQNLGMYWNFLATLNLCRGDYIALLEGDDYWTSPHKLKVQVEYLNKHTDCALCFHRVTVLNLSRGLSATVLPKDSPAFLTIEDLLHENPIPTCSAMFRRHLLGRVPGWCANLKVLDWPLFILLTQYGKAGFMERTMGAYRIHPGGLWTQTSHKGRLEATIQMLNCVDEHFKGAYFHRIGSCIAETYLKIAWCHEEQDLLSEALKASWRAVVANPTGNFEYQSTLFRLLAKLSLPTFWSFVQRLRSKPAPALVR